MKLLSACVLSLAVALSGCASGAKYKDMQAAIPTLKSEQGRIYFYRTASMFGAALQPAIALNGQAVGESKPGGFFFVDTAPGNHEVACSTEVEKKLTFALDRGEVKYVKTSVGLGLVVGRVIPELVPADQAQKDLPDLSFTGTPANKK